MMEMPIRAGRRMQDAAINWREKIAGIDEARQQHANIHRQRMTCADSVRTFQQAQDWTGGMSVSPSGRFRVIEEKRPKQKIISAEGIRWDAAWIAIIAIAVLCAAILLADLAGIGSTSKSLTKLESKINAITERNDQMKSELEIKAGDVSVCTEAVKLNLISSRGVQTIQLTAPTEANLTMMTAHNTTGGSVAD